MLSSYPTRLLADDHAHLERLMCTMTGSRTPFAALLRRKLDSAVVIAPEDAGPDLVTSGSTVRFVIDGGQTQQRRLTWAPQPDEDETQLSLRLPRGLALLGLSTGQAVPYQTDDGRTEYLEVEQVRSPRTRGNAGGRSSDQKRAAPASSGLAGMFRSALVRLQRGRTISALQRLDDEMLRDIGITRGEIPYIADIVSGITEAPADLRHIAPRVPAQASAKQMGRHEYVR
jgi:regulator of nucleoside diphosphate kinase